MVGSAAPGIYGLRDLRLSTIGSGFACVWAQRAVDCGWPAARQKKRRHLQAPSRLGPRDTDNIEAAWLARAALFSRARRALRTAPRLWSPSCLRGGAVWYSEISAL